ncbi:MAG TPA: YggS family pyridoxal phosphate-dependent enzyme [Burkholderiales bacterium]
MTTIAARLQAVLSRIDAAARTTGRSPQDIRLIAVSKIFAPAAIAQARAAGQFAFGESYLQEAVGKITALSELNLEWHVAHGQQDGEQREGGLRPSAGVASPEGPLLLPLERQAAHGQQDGEQREGGLCPSAGVASPEGPLLLPLEWQAAHGQQDGEQREGGLRPSAGVASPQAGPLLLPLEWHFIGPIQSNKTRQIAELFHWAHAVDRLKIAERLSSSRPVGLPPLQICIQVNVSGEASKSGVRPEETLALAQAISPLTGIRLRGLMAIPEPTPEIGMQRARFRQVRELKDEIVSRGIALDTLSMGMSDDLEAAVAEGATLVRVGRAIFGERPPYPA